MTILKRKAKLQIVSVWYNRENYVAESISSVVEQLTTDMILTLVDDGSTDGTLAELQKFSKYSNVEIVDKPNSGFVTSIKLAISARDSNYIAIHGAGDISLPNRFNLQLELLESTKSVVCGCRFKNSNSTKLYGKKIANVNYSKKIIKSNPFSHGEVMFCRDAYNQVGGYRTFFKYAQDRDLWCRLSTVGNFVSVDQHLYTRSANMENNVSNDIIKIIEQRYYSSFALYLHKVAISNECYDYLDIDAVDALMFSSRGDIRRELIKHYFISIKNNKLAPSTFLLRQIKKECPFYQVSFISIFHYFVSRLIK